MEMLTYGQTLDMLLAKKSKQKADGLAAFTVDAFETNRIYKTSYFTSVLPVRLGMLFSVLFCYVINLVYIYYHYWEENQLLLKKT